MPHDLLGRTVDILNYGLRFMQDRCIWCTAVSGGVGLQKQSRSPVLAAMCEKDKESRS
jgi:hypothetical protein